MKINYSLNSRIDWLANKNSIAALLAITALRKERIDCCEIKEIAPASTNAVCLTENYVVKIYAPEICGYNPLCDLERETYAFELMRNFEICVPRLIAYGLLEYDCSFYYCIVERIKIPPVKYFLRFCSKNEAIKLGKQLNEKLNIFQFVTIDRPELAKAGKLHKDSIFVYSDLTGDNVLYNGNSLAIIDFEDWHLAPPYTELPAIVFNMLYKNKHIDIAPLFFDIPYVELKEKLYAGINTHYESHRFLNMYNSLFK